MSTSHFGPQSIECGRKRRYPSRAWAELMGRMIEQAPSWDGYPLHAFECSWCGQSHLAHPPSPYTLANLTAMTTAAAAAQGQP